VNSEIISTWRDATYIVLVDIFTPASADQGASIVTPPIVFGLQSYDVLWKSYVSLSYQLEIVSEVKPIARSHYRSMNISAATPESICIRNAQKYHICDSTTGVRAKHLLDKLEIRDSCSQQLAEGPYQCLQNLVQDTKHRPNQVIAEQSACPVEISFHEFLSFGNLRAGHHLQWQNVAIALVDGSLNFNQEATRVLLTYAA
jgi:hypothetical protein